MVGIYSRIGTYSCSENKILYLKSFFSQKWHSKFTFLHTSAPSLCAQRQVLTSAAFYLKKELSVRCAKGQLSLSKRLSASPDSEEASVWKFFQVWEFPARTILEATHFKILKKLFVRNFKEEIYFLALNWLHWFCLRRLHPHISSDLVSGSYQTQTKVNLDA